MRKYINNSKTVLLEILIFTVIGFYSPILFAQDTNSDAIYLKVLREYQLNQDGSIDFHYSCSKKLLTYFSINYQYGETYIFYNTKYQKVKVNYSRTTMQDGKVVESPANAYNEILPGMASDAPEYNHLRELVVTHTGLERNAVIDVDYNITTQKDFYPELMGNECITVGSPIKDYVYIIRVPSTKILKYKLFNSNVQPITTKEGDFTVYKWEFTNLPAISVEKFKPLSVETEPYLIYSTDTKLQHLYQKFINQPALKFETDEKMSQWVESLRKKSKNETDFILNLQEKISKEMKTYDIPLNLTGYTLQTPKNVFYANGGTPLEKACLMTTLLLDAGIKAMPVMVAPTMLVDREAGNLNVFDEFLVRVYADNAKYIYLPVSYAVDQNMKYNMVGKTIVPLNSDLKIFELFTENNNTNWLKFKVSIKLNEDNTTQVKTKADLYGCADPFFKIIKDSTDFIPNLLDGITSEKTDLKKIVNEGVIESIFEYDGELSKSATRLQDNYMFLTLPISPDGFESVQIKGLSENRIATFKFPYPLAENYDFTISIPKNLVLLTENVHVSISNSVGTLVFEVKKEKNQVQVIKQLEIKKTYINPDEYLQFYDLLSKWKVINNKTLIFKKNTK